MTPADLLETIVAATRRIVEVREAAQPLAALAERVATLPSRPGRFFGALSVYYGDIVYYEPRLLELYDEILPQIDRALGESPAERPH